MDCGTPAGSDWKERCGAAGTPPDQRRNSPMVEISMLLAECIQHGLRTIAFCKTRKLCELVTAYTRETLRATAPHLADKLKVGDGPVAQGFWTAFLLDDTIMDEFIWRNASVGPEPRATQNASSVGRKLTGHYQSSEFIV